MLAKKGVEIERTGVENQELEEQGNAKGAGGA
jgi:hypothetical protein